MLKTNHKGFSMVELTIVVAIIGLLAAIGIPSYSKMKAKARETEAKAALSALFIAEKSFHSEYGFYHTSLSTIGFSMEGKLYFNVGFGNPTNVVPSDYGYFAPINVAEINTKTQCPGANGTGTDTRCRFQVNVPDISLIATTTPEVYFAAAVSTPENYAYNTDVPEEGPSRLEMIAQFLLEPQEAQAIAFNETTCSLAFNNPLNHIVLYKRCVEEGVITRQHLAADPTTQVWFITSKKIFKGLR